MNWKKIYEGFKKGDKVRIVEIYGDEDEVYFSIDEELILSDFCREDRNGKLWATEKIDCYIYEHEMEKVL